MNLEGMSVRQSLNNDILIEFSLQFLPHSNDGTIVTGAADCKIRVHDIQTQETTQLFSCHVGRVKRIATCPNVPFMFWSAAEDGTIM